MANFRTHMTWGVILGFGSILASLMLSIISGIELIVGVFFSVLVGSFLPDLDLDDGMPFKILFGLLSMGIAVGTIFSLYQHGEDDFTVLLFVSLGIFVIVRFGFGHLFKSITSHRGMFHSLPAAILAGLISFWLLKFASFGDEKRRLWLGIAVIIGYFGHLLLDEIYSTVNFSGHSIMPKQSLGSAWKLKANSKVATIIVYASIILLGIYLL